MSKDPNQWMKWLEQESGQCYEDEGKILENSEAEKFCMEIRDPTDNTVIAQCEELPAEIKGNCNHNNIVLIAEVTDDGILHMYPDESGATEKIQMEEIVDEDVIDPGTEENTMVITAIDAAAELSSHSGQQPLPSTNSDDADTTVEPVKRKRRRFPDPNEWNRNIRKNKRLCGESYINRKGKAVQEKSVKRNHTNNCRYKCLEKISLEQQHGIFKQYYNFKNADRQKEMLCKLVKKESVARVRKRSKDSNIQRSASMFYYLPDTEGEPVRVCQEFFLQTFHISKTVVANSLNFKSPQGNYVGVDRRIGRPARNKTPEDVASQVTTFLNNFPKVPSQYCRKDSSRLYLSPDINQSVLYRLYLESEFDPKVSESVFRDMFKKYEPPLSTFKPKKDQCSRCRGAERLKVTETDQDYIAHVKRKEEIYEMQNTDLASAVDNKKLVCGSFDLQAILTIPFAGDTQIYYKRKLSLYNFTIFDSFQNGNCYLWDETHGKKGSAEIGSCLLHYISVLNAEVEHLILYADTCGGQNRNQNVAAALLYAMNKKVHTNLKILDLKFMESGHSYLKADSIYASIERHRKHKTIYSLNEYKLVIEMSRLTPKPYVVNLRTFDSVFNLLKLTKGIITNRTKDSNRTNVNWLKIKWLRFEVSSSTILFKYDVKSPFLIIVVNPKTIPWESIELTSNYDSQLPISLQKKKDLKELLIKGVIPTEYKEFYEKLPAAKEVKDKAAWVNEGDESMNEGE